MEEQAHELMLILKREQSNLLDWKGKFLHNHQGADVLDLLNNGCKSATDSALEMCVKFREQVEELASETSVAEVAPVVWVAF